MTETEFLAAVDAARSRNPEWRYGQTVFNVLRETDPDASDYITGSMVLDPFYVDERVPALLEWLRERG